MRRPAVSRFVVSASLAVLLIPDGLRAQTPAPGSAAAALSTEADGFFDRRQYKDAIVDYTKLLAGYPNSEYAVDAQFHLAYANFLTSQFQPAVDGLRKVLASPTSSPELLELAAGLLPQVLSQQASDLKPDDKGRTKAFEAAIKEYDNFIAKYPKSTTLETAFYGRALAAYQIARYDAAVRDLRQNLAAFPTSDTILDSTFLLSLTLATQANLAFAKENRSPADADAALKNYVESERLLSDIINRRTDISLANDAQFQLGETFLAHAGNTPAGAAQVPLYQRALTAFREVQPKEPMIAAQTARVARLNDARIAELRKGAAGDRNLTRRLDAQRLREQTKLEALQAKEDPVLTARLQCGAVFADLRRYDETRVLMTSLAPEARRPEDEKLVLYYTALSYAGQNLTDKAVAAYDKFQAAFSGDPIAENLPRARGQPVPERRKTRPGDGPPGISTIFHAALPQEPPARHRALLVQAQVRRLARAVRRRAQNAGHFSRGQAQAGTRRAGRPQPRAHPHGQERPRRARWRRSGRCATRTRLFPKARKRRSGSAGRCSSKKDAAGAVSELTAFVHAASRKAGCCPARCSRSAQAQQAAGAKDQALATLTDLSTRFPQTHGGGGGVRSSARTFIFPIKNTTTWRGRADGVRGQASRQRPGVRGLRAHRGRADPGQPDRRGGGDLREIPFPQPDSPHAPDMLARLAALWLRAARGLGSFIVLGPPQRETWTHDVKNSIAACERAVAKYPDAPATALALQTLLDGQKLLVDARQQTLPQVIDYFHKLADQNTNNPAAHSRILFRLASLTAEKDPAQALAEMQAAYDPTVIYSPADLDAYGSALLKTDPTAAGAVFEKAAKDYPLPPGVAPAQAAPDVQEAQALALFGRGTLAASSGDGAEAGRAFAELKKQYPRSSKVAEADLGLAENLMARGKPDDALPLLAEVARSSTAPLAVRARGMFLNGDVQAAKGLPGAIDAYSESGSVLSHGGGCAGGFVEGRAVARKTGGHVDRNARHAGRADEVRPACSRAQGVSGFGHQVCGSSEHVAAAKARLAALPADKQGS